MDMGRRRRHAVVSRKTAKWQSVVIYFAAVNELVAAVFSAQLARTDDRGISGR